VQTSDLFAFRDRLSFDHFHPANEGYELIARRIAERCRKASADDVVRRRSDHAGS